MVVSYGSHRAINAGQNSRRGYAHGGMEMDGDVPVPGSPWLAGATTSSGVSGSLTSCSRRKA